MRQEVVDRDLDARCVQQSQIPWTDEFYRIPGITYQIRWVNKDEFWFSVERNGLEVRILFRHIRLLPTGIIRLVAL